MTDEKRAQIEAAEAELVEAQTRLCEATADAHVNGTWAEADARTAVVDSIVEKLRKLKESEVVMSWSSPTSEEG